jgi:hypothetical protein
MASRAAGIESGFSLGLIGGIGEAGFNWTLQGERGLEQLMIKPLI